MMDPVAQPGLRVLALGGELPSPAASGNDAVVSKLEIGDPALGVKLLDLACESVDLAACRGTPTLMLFWSLGCGHRRRILDEIKTCEATPPEGAPKLFVVSSGEPERNRAMAPRSTGTFPSAKRSALAARPRRCCSTPTTTLRRLLRPEARLSRQSRGSGNTSSRRQPGSRGSHSARIALPVQR